MGAREHGPPQVVSGCVHARIIVHAVKSFLLHVTNLLLPLFVSSLFLLLFLLCLLWATVLDTVAHLSLHTPP